MKDIIPSIKGELTIYKNGKIIRQQNNLVVNIGIYRELDLLIGAVPGMSSTTGPIQYWNIGNGVAVAQVTDIELNSPVVGNRQPILAATRSNNIITITGTAGGTILNQIWSEFGLFYSINAGSSLFSRVVFDPYSKVLGEVLDWSYKLTQ